MINSRNLNDLHPTLKRGALELTKRLKNKNPNYILGISCTYRDIEYQNLLFAKGRTAPGNIVTMARGGQSMHNYGLAFDIFKNISGQEYADNNFFVIAGKIWVDMGGVWGGNFKNLVDKPHFEFTNGLSLTNLQQGAKVSNNVKMKWEIK